MTDFTINALRSFMKYPENYFLFGINVLESRMKECTEAKVSIIAELFVRVFFSGNMKSREASIINGELTNGELQSFMDLFPGPHFSPDLLSDNLWDVKDDFSSRCMAAVRKRFQMLFTADGMIPVYAGDMAFFIPFHFNEKGLPAGIYDMGNNEIEDWSGYLLRLGIESRVTIHCFTGKKLHLTGGSLMLPLQMAWWRKNGDLPQYNVFRFLSTGTFNEKMQLASVATEEKVNAALEQFKGCYFICPESDGKNSSGRPNVKCLPCGIERETILKKVQPNAEMLDRVDQGYAFRRMGAFEKEVNQENYSRWDDVIRRLENAARFSKTNPEQQEAYLVNLMLQAQACCHAGRTDKGYELNERACKFAGKHSKFLKLFLRLQIDRMVLLQDKEGFVDALELAEKFKDKFIKLGDVDLLMRYYGTIGQAYSYGTLSGLPGFDREKALDCFEKAIENAEEKKSLSDISQDKNYLHLYYALFEPGGIDEEDALEQARDIVLKLNEVDKSSAVKCLYYLTRARVMAWYRQLRGGKMPDYKIDGDIRNLLSSNKDVCADDWIRTCVGKYLGALEAAAGKMDRAAEYFKNAVDAVNEEDPSVKTLIRITACAEAYNSLKNAEYLEKGRELAELLSEEDFPLTLPKWKEYLANPDAVELPWRSFWY